MCDVGADLAVAFLHPLLDLVEEVVKDLSPACRLVAEQAGFPAGDVVAHGVVRAAGQLAGISKTARQIKGSKNFHDLLGKLQGFPPRGRWSLEHAQQTPGGDLNGGFRKLQSDGWAGLLSASGQFS